MGLQSGIPLFYLQGMGGGAVLKFRDLFNDSSQFWAWQLFLGETPAGKSGTEENGVYKFTIDTDIEGLWTPAVNEAPRLSIGAIAYPCEIVTRLTEMTTPEGGAGLFLAKSALQVGLMDYFAIVRQDWGAGQRIAIAKDGINVAEAVVTTIPIWFRIRLGSGSVASVTAYFDYSEDGLTWINLYELPEFGIYYFSFAPPCVGIFATNYPTLKACEAKFGYFQMKPKSIN